MRAFALGLLILVAGCGDSEIGAISSTTGSSDSAATTAAGGGGTGATGGAATTTGEAGAGATGATSTGGTGGTGSTGGTSGSGATGGSGGATTGVGGASTTSTSTTTTGGGMPGPCLWGDDCGAGYYCFAPGCAMGDCIPKPGGAGLSPDAVPVCGCDGVTYWNQEVAASKGASIATMGACSMPIACGPQMPCPGSMKCSREVPDSASCSPDVTGECWGTAISCPLEGPKARACTNRTCELTCSLIQSQNAWFQDPTCN